MRILRVSYYNYVYGGYSGTFISFWYIYLSKNSHWAEGTLVQNYVCIAVYTIIKSVLIIIYLLTKNNDKLQWYLKNNFELSCFITHTFLNFNCLYNMSTTFKMIAFKYNYKTVYLLEYRRIFILH